jgi:hypothetical protein
LGAIDVSALCQRLGVSRGWARRSGVVTGFVIVYTVP